MAVSSGGHTGGGAGYSCLFFTCPNGRKKPPGFLRKKKMATVAVGKKAAGKSK
ncbi:MAG: hypothetical protein WBJ43_05035 [Smithellaceae bacterium]|jgi:hypothetical protein